MLLTAEVLFLALSIIVVAGEPKPEFNTDFWYFNTTTPKSPTIDTVLLSADDTIDVDGKIKIRNTIRFSDASADVTVTLFPTIDLPDFAITKVTKIKVGRNLCIMGSLDPIMDYGNPNLQTPGQALSMQFKLGMVINMGIHDNEMDDSLVIVYEAEVMKPQGLDIGHTHTYGGSVEADNTVDKVYKKAVFVSSTPPKKTVFFATGRKPVLSVPTRKPIVAAPVRKPTGSAPASLPLLFKSLHQTPVKFDAAVREAEQIRQPKDTMTLEDKIEISGEMNE